MEVNSYRLLDLLLAFPSRIAVRKSLLMEAINFRVGTFFSILLLASFSIGGSL